MNAIYYEYIIVGVKPFVIMRPLDVVDRSGPNPKHVQS